jgi:hypothetical protein
LFILIYLGISLLPVNLSTMTPFGGNVNGIVLRGATILTKMEWNGDGLIKHAEIHWAEYHAWWSSCLMHRFDSSAAGKCLDDQPSPVVLLTTPNSIIFLPHSCFEISSRNFYDIYWGYNNGKTSLKAKDFFEYIITIHSFPCSLVLLG